MCIANRSDATLGIWTSNPACYSKRAPYNLYHRVNTVVRIETDCTAYTTIVYGYSSLCEVYCHITTVAYHALRHSARIIMTLHFYITCMHVMSHIPITIQMAVPALMHAKMHTHPMAARTPQYSYGCAQCHT